MPVAGGRETDCEIIGEAVTASETRSIFKKLLPDLVFLGIQMSDGDGFRVSEELPENSLPAVVFVTAYDLYAVKAFDLHAFDYLLKPIDEARFRQATNRAGEKFNRRSNQALKKKFAGLLDYFKLNQIYLDNASASF